jgi:hypothetical protein
LVGAVADVVRGDEAIALGIDISKTANYKEGQLTRFVSLEYKSDLRRDGSDYLSKNAEQVPHQQNFLFFLNILFINSLKLPSNSTDGGNLIPYTLTLKATALVQDKPYRVKVRATLTTETILGTSFETADKIINVTVEGLRITTASVLRAVTSTE